MLEPSPSRPNRFHPQQYAALSAPSRTPILADRFAIFRLRLLTMKRRRDTPKFDATDPLLDAKPRETLDLHGYAASEAVEAVRRFLSNWARRVPGGVVHIVTGKGKGSAGKPVLKPKVKALLAGELRHLVSDWERDADDAGFMVRLR